MSSARKRSIRSGRTRAKRRGAYTFGIVVALVIIIIVGVGYALYASSQSKNVIVHGQIITTQGVMEIELYQSKAPRTVDNFVNLAKQGFYDNLVWHRIIKGFVIQTGDPTSKGGGGDNSTWGQHGSQQTVPLEIDSSLHNNVGYLGMARSTAPDSGSSQFYINLVDNSALLDPRPPDSPGYAVFGRVTSGMNVALAIGNLSTTGSNGSPPDQPLKPLPLVTSITITS